MKDSEKKQKTVGLVEGSWGWLELEDCWSSCSTKRNELAFGKQDIMLIMEGWW